MNHLVSSTVNVRPATLGPDGIGETGSLLTSEWKKLQWGRDLLIAELRDVTANLDRENFLSFRSAADMRPLRLKHRAMKSIAVLSGTPSSKISGNPSSSKIIPSFAAG
jgi:hypothetical protein